MKTIFNEMQIKNPNHLICFKEMKKQKKLEQCTTKTTIFKANYKKFPMRLKGFFEYEKQCSEQ